MVSPGRYSVANKRHEPENIITIDAGLHLKGPSCRVISLLRNFIFMMLMFDSRIEK